MKRKWLKKTGSFIAVLCMLLAMLPVTVLANPNDEMAENKNGAGEKVEIKIEIPEDAIKLSTPEDVLALVENCRVNTWSVGKTVVLSNNIDMSEVDMKHISDDIFIKRV